MKLKILIKFKLAAFLGVLLTIFQLNLEGKEPQLRSFDAKQMQEYASQQDFDYMNYAVLPPSIWQRISWWVSDFYDRFFSNPNTPWLTRIAYYVALLLILGLTIYYIIKLKYGGGLSNDYTSYKTGITGIEQAPVEDFEKLISDAIANQNHKLAIRYIYLRSLATLAKRKMIILKEWKSPYDYERELKSEMQAPYREMAKLFEYVWYGDFEVGEREFHQGQDLSLKLEQAG